MILDTIDQAERYFPLHPLFARGFEWLRTVNWQELPNGRQEIDGDRLFVSFSRNPGRGRAASPLEFHRRYIDIQVSFSGTDEMGWSPLAQCQQVKKPFDPETDVGLFSDAPQLWYPLPPGSFTILYPEDAHAPLGATGPLVKAVVKVLLSPE